MGLRLFLLTLSIFFGFASATRAEVILTFWSHDLGTYRNDIAFYHAFITLTGSTHANKTAIHANFGFTASETTPSILLQSVPGAVASMPNDYVASSRRHFSVPINDEQYRAVLAVIKRWQKYRQPSYNLDRHNCVIFVREIALALHLPVSNDSRLFRSPVEFLEDLKTRAYAQISAAQRKPPSREVRLSVASKTTKGAAPGFRRAAR